MKLPRQRCYVRSLNTTSSTSVLVLVSEIDEAHIVDVSLSLSVVSWGKRGGGGGLPVCSYSVLSCLCDCLVNCIRLVPSAVMVVSIKLLEIIAIYPPQILNKITAEMVRAISFKTNNSGLTVV